MSRSLGAYPRRRGRASPNIRSCRYAALHNTLERPKKPEEVVESQATVHQRTDEFRDIFTSRHSDECAELRARLRELDEEVAQLHVKIGGLEEDLQEATAERMKDDSAKEPRVAVAEERDSVHFQVGAFQVGQAPSELPEREDNNPSDKKDSVSFEKSEVQVKAGSKASEAGSEHWSPVLQARRLEARLREAAIVHESALAQMRAEETELERRMRKQQVWMKSVDDQVLRAEVLKTQYSVRLEHAQRRVATLGANINEAYDTLTKLVEVRLGVEKEAIRNDAVVAYLDLLRQKDDNNADTFVDNQRDLTRLLDRFSRCQQAQSSIESLINEACGRRKVSNEVVECTETLRQCVDDLRKLWAAVPENLKENASITGKTDRSSRKSLAINKIESMRSSCMKSHNMHPQEAMNTIVDSATEIRIRQSEYIRLLADCEEQLSQGLEPFEPD